VHRDWLTRHKLFTLKVKCGETELKLGGDPRKLDALLPKLLVPAEASPENTS